MLETNLADKSAQKHGDAGVVEEDATSVQREDTQHADDDDVAVELERAA